MGEGNGEGSEERSACGLAGQYEEGGRAREEGWEEGRGWAIPEGILLIMDTLY